MSGGRGVAGGREVRRDDRVVVHEASCTMHGRAVVHNKARPCTGCPSAWEGYSGGERGASIRGIDRMSLRGVDRGEVHGRVEPERDAREVAEDTTIRIHFMDAEDHIASASLPRHALGDPSLGSPPALRPLL